MAAAVLARLALALAACLPACEGGRWRVVDWWWARAVGSVRSLMDGQARLSVSSRLVFVFFSFHALHALASSRLQVEDYQNFDLCFHQKLYDSTDSTFVHSFCVLSYHYVRECSAASRSLM